jgi:hypothetical protein
VIAPKSSLILLSGVAIYYWSPLWPYAVDTLLTLDSEPPVVVTMTDPSESLPIGSVGPSVISQVLWGQTGLSNTQHTLVISLAPGARYIVVDALMSVEILCRPKYSYSLL